MPALICVVSHAYMYICFEYVCLHVRVCAYWKCVLSIATGWTNRCRCSTLASTRLPDLAWFPLTPYRSLSNIFLRSLGMGGSAATLGAPGNKQKGWKAPGPSLLCFRFCHFMLTGNPPPTICKCEVCVSLSQGTLCSLGCYWRFKLGMVFAHLLSLFSCLKDHTS